MHMRHETQPYRLRLTRGDWWERVVTKKRLDKLREGYRRNASPTEFTSSNQVAIRATFETIASGPIAPARRLVVRDLIIMSRSFRDAYSPPFHAPLSLHIQSLSTLLISQVPFICLLLEDYSIRISRTMRFLPIYIGRVSADTRSLVRISTLVSLFISSRQKNSPIQRLTPFPSLNFHVYGRIPGWRPLSDTYGPTAQTQSLP